MFERRSGTIIKLIVTFSTNLQLEYSNLINFLERAIVQILYQVSLIDRFRNKDKCLMIYIVFNERLRGGLEIGK